MTIVRATRCLVAVLALAYTACGPSYGITQSTFAVQQRGALPAPSGPLLAGPAVTPGHVAVEGSFAYDANRTGSATLAQGGSPNYTIDTRGDLKLLFNPGGGIEIGPAFEWSFGGLTAGSSDLPTGHNFFFARFGAPIRIPFVRDRRWTVGANLELLPTVVSLARSTERTDTVTPYQDCTTGGCVPTTTPQESYTRSSTVDSSARPLTLTARLGLYGGGRVGSRFSVLGGVLVQHLPEVVGSQVLHSTCDTRTSGYPTNCVDPDPDSVRSVFVGTAWLSFGVDVGRVTFYAQGYVNALGPTSIVAHSPAGVTMTTRVTF